MLYTMEHSDYLYQRDWCGDAWFFTRPATPRRRIATPRRRRRDRRDVATPRAADATEDEFDDRVRADVGRDDFDVARQYQICQALDEETTGEEGAKLMVDDLREREELRVQEENEEHMQKFEDDCRKRRNEEIGGYGKPRSRWERLWDAGRGQALLAPVGDAGKRLGQAVHLSRV